MENNAPGTRAENPAGRGAYLTDDEILGLVSDAMARDREYSRGTEADPARNMRHRKNAHGVDVAAGENGTIAGNGETDASSADGEGDAGDPGAINVADGSVPENLRAAIEENPELRQAWQDAQDYREIFATPQAAREATAMLGDLNRLDALFFSRRPEDHAELAKTVAQLDPAAFASLARAMAAVAAQQNGGTGTASGAAATHAAPQNAATNSSPAADASISQEAAPKPAANEAAQASNTNAAPAGLTPAQAEFFQAANASAVEGVLEAIESQLDRLLPENMPARARARVAGEVYRELDAALRGNRQFTDQVRARVSVRDARCGTRARDRFAGHEAGAAGVAGSGQARIERVDIGAGDRECRTPRTPAIRGTPRGHRRNERRGTRVAAQRFAAGHRLRAHVGCGYFEFVEFARGANWKAKCQFQIGNLRLQMQAAQPRWPRMLRMRIRNRAAKIAFISRWEGHGMPCPYGKGGTGMHRIVHDGEIVRRVRAWRGRWKFCK